MDGKEFLESKQVKNIVLGISNQIGVVDLATLLDLYRTEQLKLHIVSNSALEQAKIEAMKRIKMVTDSALYEYQRALENGRCEECKDPLVKGESNICEDCLCPV